MIAHNIIQDVDGSKVANLEENGEKSWSTEFHAPIMVIRSAVDAKKSQAIINLLLGGIPNLAAVNSGDVKVN